MVTPTTAAGKPGRKPIPNLKQICVLFPGDELNDLDTAADAAAISRSYAIRTAVQDWLKRRKRAA